MIRLSLGELPQEASVSLKHQPKIRDLVKKHRDSLQPQTEREARQLGRITRVAGNFEKPSVNHSCAKDLDPARSATDLADFRRLGGCRLAPAVEAADIHFGARLNERKITRP